MRRRLLALAVLVGLMAAWSGAALWRSGSAASYSQSVSISPPKARAAPGPPVELEFTILKIPAGARSQKAVLTMLEGIGPQAIALTPQRTATLSDQMLLAIAPAYVGVVSRPRLRVLSGTEAELKIAENVPIGAATTPVQGDLLLRVSPQLAPDGAATLGVALSSPAPKAPSGSCWIGLACPWPSTPPAPEPLRPPRVGASRSPSRSGATSCLWSRCRGRSPFPSIPPRESAASPAPARSSRAAA